MNEKYKVSVSIFDNIRRELKDIKKKLSPLDNLQVQVSRLVNTIDDLINILENNQ
jgi:phage-related minor tail protein